MSTDLFNRLSFKASEDGRERKDFALDIKEIDEAGKFSGFASTYGNVDQGGDVVEAGAFRKTIAEHGKEVVILWHHDPRIPIGLGKLEDTKEGLVLHGELDLELAEGKSAYRRMKGRMVKGLSIGFQTVKDAMKDGVRYLKEVRLFEVSLVTFPMNLQATITAVKANEQKMDFNESLDSVEIWAKHWQMVEALCNALDSVRYDIAIPDDEKLKQVDDSISQFHDKYLEYFPKFLALMQQSMSLRQAAEAEHKAGRRLSAASRQQIEDGIAKLSQATESLRALLTEEAADDTALPPPEPPKQQPTEPEKLHSFVVDLKSQIEQELRIC